MNGKLEHLFDIKQKNEEEYLVEKIFNIISPCDTNKLNDIVVELVQNHIFTSKDSIGHLIDMLEDLKEEY